MSNRLNHNASENERNSFINNEFEPACLAAFDTLRGSLIELYASVGADPASPQTAARRFRVNKTLTWNISRVVASTDPIATLPNVPGASAFKSLLQAFERAGAKPEAIKRVRAAAESLDQIVERHVGDRATLELVVDGLRDGRDDHLEVSRKLAFRGNSGLWGVQARTRLMSVFMAPNAADPDRLDLAIVRGFLGLRRLRAGVRWPIFHTRGWGEQGEPVTADRWQPLESAGDEHDGLPLMQRFSSVERSAIEEVRAERGLDYVLAPGPIGNAGAVDCYIGDFARSAASKYRTQHDTTGEFGATISVPTERLVFDLIVHESLDFALSPDVRAFGGIFANRSEEPSPAGSLPIPVPENVTLLPGQPPVVATPLVQRYPEIVTFVHERLGSNPAEFRGCRLDLTYPPLGSTVLLRFNLPKATNGVS